MKTLCIPGHMDQVVVSNKTLVHVDLKLGIFNNETKIDHATREIKLRISNLQL